MNKINTRIAALFIVSCFAGFNTSAQYISTFAGRKTTDTLRYSGDGGLAVNALLNGCTGVAVDGAGNVYIADRDNNVVRKVNTAGVISTFAGTGVAGYSGNGGSATAAMLNKPAALVTDGAGNVYVSDQGNNRIRKINAMGIISNYAGIGVAAYTGDADSATAAAINGPDGLAIDASGNLYIADAGNNAIRMVSTSGIISTVAGNGTIGSAGDGGPATAASLYSPSGVATDAAGNLYIADVLNNKIRKVSGTGVITTIAGTGVAGNTGNGSAAIAATLRYPTGVSVDGSGNVYIADQGNYNVRVINTSGIITNYAGTSTSGYDGDGGLATAAKLGAPKSVYVDGWGRVYVSDITNHIVRVVTASASVTSATNSNKLTVFPNPTDGNVTISMPQVYSVAVVSVTDMMGRTILQKQLSAGLSSQSLNLSHLAAGSYILSVSTDKQVFTNKLVIE